LCWLRFAALDPFQVTDPDTAETLLTMWARRAELSPADVATVLAAFPVCRPLVTDETADYAHRPAPVVDYNRSGFCERHGGYLGHCLRCSALASKATDVRREGE
jgi:hypothetical protein